MTRLLDYSITRLRESLLSKGNRLDCGRTDSPERLWTETPSRRTGRRPASVFDSSATARAAISASLRVGVAVWLRVIVVKSAYRTLMVTVLANRSFRASQLTAFEAIPAIS